LQKRAPIRAVGDRNTGGNAKTVVNKTKENQIT
jgi:hypothetical protein